MKHPSLNRLGALLISIGLVTSPRAAQSADATLFQDLGGIDGITRIVDALAELYLTDDRIKATFEDINIPRLKGRLVLQFCVLAGGPCVYKGASMHTVHQGYKITVAQFNALVEDLQIAMERQNIPYWTQNRLLAVLAPMEREIVSR